MKIDWAPGILPRRDYRPALAFLIGMALLASLGLLWQCPSLYFDRFLSESGSHSETLTQARGLHPLHPEPGFLSEVKP